jgi:uncharacterized protein YkwD
VIFIDFMGNNSFFKKYKIVVFLFFLLSSFIFVRNLEAASLGQQLSGRILLQVESHGEAWYVSPANLMRYYLGRPDDAFRIMREQGIGISNKNLEKIPVNINTLIGNDADGDGLPDSFEKAIGTNWQSPDTDSDGIADDLEIKNNYNPKGTGKLPLDIVFAQKQKGKIFLQVESRGEAWYVNLIDGKRYFLGQPIDAFNIFRQFGLGISNLNLNKIPVMAPEFVPSEMEEKIHILINKERNKNNLSSLKWNSEVASVAREHSQNLAKENEAFTKIGWTCSTPFIHHEGNVFGLYQDERLRNRGIQYFSNSGENIALNQTASIKFTYIIGDTIEDEYIKCDEERIAMDNKYKETVESLKNREDKLNLLQNEIAQRINKFNSGQPLHVTEVNWLNSDEVAAKMVEGWMNSPGHKRNILDAEYDEAGIGVVQFNGLVIATQVFIKRINCGYQGGQCCEKAGYYPYCYLPNKCTTNVCR